MSAHGQVSSVVSYQLECSSPSEAVLTRRILAEARPLFEAAEELLRTPDLDAVLDRFATIVARVRGGRTPNGIPDEPRCNFCGVPASRHSETC